MMASDVPATQLQARKSSNSQQVPMQKKAGKYSPLAHGGQGLSFRGSVPFEPAARTSNQKENPMKNVSMRTMLTLTLPVVLAGSTAAHQLLDPSIVHDARDGVVRLYGAGGPDTAFKRIAEVFTKEAGIRVEIVAGPEPTWSKQAQANADILWGTAEEDMAGLLETYKAFAWNDVTPIYIRPSIIAVKKGNPKHIRGFEDLLNDGIKIVVTEGAGVANTSGTGTWEDVAGREGRLEDVKRFRKNIVGFGKGSGPSYKMFVEKNADAWITWPDWPITHSDNAEIVPLSKSRTIWRDVNIVLAHDADPEAKQFLDFLTSDRAAAIMKTEGWER
jgi:accessory colonization factor AcfC